VVLGTKAVDKKTLSEQLRPDQKLVDLVNLEKDSRCNRPEYEGICW